MSTGTDPTLTLKHVAASRIATLQEGYLANQPAAVRSLAELRRTDPAKPGSNPQVWAATLGHLPDVLTHLGGRTTDEPTPSERALHAALVLFALHAQSQRAAVHAQPADGDRSISFGAAVGRLARARAQDEEMDASTVRRLQRAALATTIPGRLEHLQALVRLMRGENPPIAFDYGQFAVDLRELFDPYRDTNRVLVRWARDLHARPKPSATNTDPEQETK